MLLWLRPRQSSGKEAPTLSALPFYNVEYNVDAEPVKQHKSCRQRKREKFLHTTVSSSLPPEPEVPLDFKIPGNIVELQQQDESLAEYLF